MQFHKQLRVGLLSAGLMAGWACAARAEDKPPVEPPKPGAEAGQKPGPGGREGGRPDPQRMLERMRQSFDGLNLSDEQKAKLKEITDAAKGKLAAVLKETEGAEPRERMQKIREAMQPIREQAMDVLDETQKEKLRENMRQAGPRDGARRPGAPDSPGGKSPRDAGGPGDRKHRKPGRPDGAGGPPGSPGHHRDPAAMIEHLRDNVQKLALDDEQKKKVDALLSETEKKLIDLRAESDKAAADTRGKFREAMQSNRQKLEEILTTEQKDKLKEMMPPRPDVAGGQGRPGEGRPPRGEQGGPGGGPRPEGDRPQGPPPGEPKQ